MADRDLDLKLFEDFNSIFKIDFTNLRKMLTILHASAKQHSLSIQNLKHQLDEKDKNEEVFERLATLEGRYKSQISTQDNLKQKIMEL